MIWFVLVLWHINHCRLFKAKSHLYIYIRYIGFCLVWFHGISTIVGYLMPNSLYLHIYWIYRNWFGWILWDINRCRLSNAKSFLYLFIKYIWFGLVLFYWIFNHCRVFNTKPFLYLYIKYIGFGLVWFYGISTIVGYLRPNPLYTYI